MAGLYIPKQMQIKDRKKEDREGDEEREKMKLRMPRVLTLIFPDTGGGSDDMDRTQRRVRSDNHADIDRGAECCGSGHISYGG